MNYKILFDTLLKNPPKGWRIVHHVANERGGVYLWPSHVPHLTEPPNVNSDGRLLHFSILFEFHIIPSNKPSNNRARILARARYDGENDLRWIIWNDLATKHCGVTKVEEKGHPKTTKSVGKWFDGTLQKIKFNTSPKKTAEHIRNYLENPPDSLTFIIGHLGQNR